MDQARTVLMDFLIVWGLCFLWVISFRGGL